MLGIIVAMATLRQKVDAERRGREMLEAGEIPQPDSVEYGYTCIRFYWLESKAVLVIDIDEPPDGYRSSQDPDIAATIDDGEDR